MKKLWLFTTLCLFSSAFLFAQDNCPPSKCPCPKENCACDPCECCPPPAVCDQGYEAPDHLVGAYNAPARFDVRCKWDFFARADFIYWSVLEKGLDLGVYAYNPVNSSAGEVQDMKTKYKPGFKVGLGWNTIADDWTLFAQYTFFHNKITKGADKSKIEAFSPAWVDFPEEGDKVAARARWDRDFDLLDVELSRCFYVGSQLTFEPYYGIRAYWHKQKYKMLVESNDAGTSIENSFYARQKSWALGAKCGIHTRWLVGDGFRIFGDTSGALVYQDFTTKFTTKIADIVWNKYKADIGFLTPNFSITLGLGWGKYFHNSSYHVDVLAGYEFNYFWNQNMMRNLHDKINLLNQYQINSDIGDLMMHGLTAGVRLDF